MVFIVKAIADYREKVVVFKQTAFVYFAAVDIDAVFCPVIVDPSCFGFKVTVSFPNKSSLKIILQFLPAPIVISLQL